MLGLKSLKKLEIVILVITFLVVVTVGGIYAKDMFGAIIEKVKKRVLLLKA